VGDDNDASYGVRVNGKVDEAVIFNEMKKTGRGISVI
jgi:hypothetical protein